MMPMTPGKPRPGKSPAYRPRFAYEFDGVRTVTYIDTPTLLTPTHEKFRRTRLVDIGDYCEWPVCSLVVPKPNRSGVRILNVNEEYKDAMDLRSTY